MNYKRIIKIFLSLSLIFVFLFTGVNVFAFDASKEQYVFKSDGSKVYHYGTGEPVIISKEYLTAEYEMRGVWVATVYNIAIQPQGGTTQKAIEKYKEEFISILDKMEEYNMNTLYFQVRPSNDAFYKSELNPWSQFLAGAGVDPGWDPLEWMIEETHKRGFVFQCWMNAFRVTVYSVLPDSEKKANYYSNEDLIKYKKAALDVLAKGNFAKENPDCVVLGEDDTRLILNPSDPRVQQFLVDTVIEIVENYDVDGLHFDDYFYLSGGGGANTYNGNFAGGKTYDSKLVGEKQLNDLPNYQDYLKGDSKYAHLERGLNLGDFRRASLDHMIKNIHEAVKAYNEKNNDCVEFGAKPAAVWRSNIEYCTENYDRCVENGSNTHASAYSSYNDLFANTLNWVEQGWVDYIAPQVYYGFSSKEAPYADIVKWWAEQVERVNAQNKLEGKKEIKLYIAHGIYKYEDSPSEFSLPTEVRNQLYYNQKFESIKGSAFYSYEHLYQFASTYHEKGMELVKTTWSQKTIPLPVGENDAKNLSIENYRLRKAIGSNNYSVVFDLLENTSVYALYKVKKGEELNISDVTSRVLVEFEGYQENKQISLMINEYDENYDYYIKVFSNHYHVSESTLKVDFEKTENYIPLEVKGNINIENAVAPSSDINISLEPLYKENGVLEYKVFVIADGEEIVVNYGTCETEKFEYVWKSYPFPSDQVKIKVVFTDGVHSETIESNYFDIKNSLKIIYNLNGGNLENAPTTFFEGEGLSELPTPTKKGYEFVGWYINGVKVDSIDSNVYTNVTLVASWKETKKGCSKNTSELLITTLSAFSLGIVILRKKK